MAPTPLSTRLRHSLCYPQSNWAPLVLVPEWVGLYTPRPLWVSPTTSPVRLGASPAAATTPTGAFNDRFEDLFPRAGALGYVVVGFTLRRFSGFSVHKCRATGCASGQTACPILPTLHQSQSRHGHASLLHGGAHLFPSYQSG